ncbi:hypothetical protein HF086_015055 [Spodoptera exigua]|uniref:Phosphoglycolate phosphatase n=1 Tax=Spodoptera exigua TaxID=7107 RepID=A0A922SB91_SPOEX|nr:hypothetical protein HF086_015055 [Spodoptera exigua]
MASTPVNLQELKPEEFKSFLDSFDYVFSDCDGVIWAKTALPGVGKFFSLMKKHGKKVHFVSNNSLRNKENYEKRFEDAEIENGFPDVGTDYYEDYILYSKDDPEIGAVVMDCDFKVNLPKLNKASAYLARPELRERSQTWWLKKQIERQSHWVNLVRRLENLL